MWSSTGAKHKRVLDETSFQQLLSAAYVVQQHNETAQKQQRPEGRLQVLGIIAEIQSLIRTRCLNVADACALIGARLLDLTGASGVSISLVDNGYLDCVAEAGVPAKVPGSSISSHSLDATEQLKLGHVFESEDSQTDSRLDRKVCGEVGVGSLVAAPVLRFGEIAGLVEVRWAKPHSFGGEELRTCRLMAGLVTGTLERSVRIGNARAATVSPPSVEIDRDVKILKEDAQLPQIAPPVVPPESPKLSDPPEPMVNPSSAAAQPPEVSPATPEVPKGTQVKLEVPMREAAKAAPAACRMCGRPFTADEQFCGFCSMPRPVQRQAEELQSKWASLWFMQQAQKALREAPRPPTEPAPAKGEIEIRGDDLAAESIPDLFPEPVLAPVEPKPLMWPRRAPPESAAVDSPRSSTPSFIAPEVSFPFEEEPALSERFGGLAKRYWRNAILAMLAMVLAYGLMLAWPKPGQPTWYQALMSRLGFNSKPVKVFAGAPDTRVWIDVHTQLYYCSGEDLYGKTPDGEFTTQYNAQSDGFLPASNTTCP